jgi:PAS domain S-box-containing protein
MLGTEFYCPDGKIKTVIEIAKLKTDSQGMPTSLDGVVQDLTSFVEKETLQLEKDLIQKATLSLITNESLRKGLEEIFTILEEYLGFDVAEALIGDELDENLIQKAVWHTSLETKVFFDSDEYPIYNTQKGLAVKAFRERKIIYEPNLAKSPYFLRKKEVTKAKLKEGIFVPILFKEKVICMFNFFYSKKPTKDYLELLEFFHYLASQIGGELQRKKVEEELNNFFNLSNDLLCLIGFDGRLKRVNARFSNHLGYSKETLSNLNLIDIIHPKNRSLLESELHALRASNSTTTFECRVLKANSEPVWLSWSASSLLNDAIIFAIAHDISDNKSFEQKLQKLNKSLEQRAEELSHSNEQLERFAYIASHDLQEPLRMVSSFMQLLEQNYSEHLDSRAKQYIYYAVDGANRMKQLILDLLQYSRVGRESKIDEQVDVGLILKEMEMIFSDELENGAKLIYGNFPVMMGNVIMMRQLFQNLISNALKYVKDKQPVVEIFYRDDEHAHILGVKDNGIGIDPKFFPKIFILFQRLHTKQDYSGTGIGLAICKKIVDLHKGKIWVESEPGKGSTFWVSIPKTF